MKKKITTIIILLIFLVGLSVLLYPTVADYFNSFAQSRVVAQHYKDLETLNEEDFEDLFEAARAYNDTLTKKPNRLVMSPAEMDEYMELLNPFGYGVMGTLIIDIINVKLPIYHGTSEGVLQIGAGHLEGSSLPIGGVGTHAVVTGHRGLPSSMLLTKLDRMIIGDIFVLHILNEVLTYRIDQIVVVEPNQMEELAIKADQDYCTLITCTPYGINTHRMLLRGTRTANVERITGEAFVYDSLAVAAYFMIPISAIVALLLGRRLHRIFGRKGWQ